MNTRRKVTSVIARGGSRVVVAGLAAVLSVASCGGDQVSIGTQDGVLSIETFYEGLPVGPVARGTLPADTSAEPVGTFDGEFWARPLTKGFFLLWSDNVEPETLRVAAKWIGPNEEGVDFTLRGFDALVGIDVVPNDFSSACDTSSPSNIDCGRFVISGDLRSINGDQLSQNGDEATGDDLVIRLGGLG